MSFGNPMDFFNAGRAGGKAGSMAYGIGDNIREVVAQGRALGIIDKNAQIASDLATQNNTAKADIATADNVAAGERNTQNVMKDFSIADTNNQAKIEAAKVAQANKVINQDANEKSQINIANTTADYKQSLEGFPEGMSQEVPQPQVVTQNGKKMILNPTWNDALKTWTWTAKPASTSMFAGLGLGGDDTAPAPVLTEEQKRAEYDSIMNPR